MLLGAGLSVSYASLELGDPHKSALIAVVSAMAALIVSYSIKIANQWERVVVLRLGRFRALKGPGLFLIIPIIDVVAYWIDIRVITTAFKAEKTLTKDTVPVDLTPCCSGRSSTQKRRRLTSPTMRAP
ncbi:SPFH domain-containing protein [Methylocystis sp. IM4]|uniref:SPFH domain-containing protein n=1 Tax=Methylocystis sp. IM4 TaxID=3136560 RepID=UPI0031199C87